MAPSRAPFVALATFLALIAITPPTTTASIPKSISEIDYTEYEPKNFNLERDLKLVGGHGYDFEDDEPSVDVNRLVPVGDEAAENDIPNRVNGELIAPRYDNLPWHEIFLDAKLIYKKNYRWWADHPEYRWHIIIGLCLLLFFSLFFIFCIVYYLVYRYFCIDLLTCDPFEEDIERYCVDDAPTYPSKLQWLDDYCEKHRRCKERGYV